MRLQRGIADDRRSFVARQGAGTLAILTGAATLIAGFWTQFRADTPLTDTADLRIVLPLGALALVAAVVGLVRRERMPGLSIAGIAMALTAPVLGWVVLVGAVAAAAVVVMLVVAKFQ